MLKTHIQWCDATANFWMGCHKVSPACKFCYMYRDLIRYGRDPNKVRRTGDATFYAALKWKKPLKIFTCSWSDFFIEEADRWRADAWDVIRRTPHHRWLILTKRPERIMQCLPPDWGEGWNHVWLGVSIESNAYFHRAITLAGIPAKVRFISAEPLLEQVDLMQYYHGKLVLDSFHWCIIGGESGNETGKYRYRPCQLSWIEKIISDLEGTGVNVFVKQLGTYLYHEMDLSDRKGGDWDEWPGHLRIRKFPAGYRYVSQ